MAAVPMFRNSMYSTELGEAGLYIISVMRRLLKTVFEFAGSTIIT